MLQFEWLPNEVLLEIFQYLHDVQLYCAFYGLNCRLNRLLAIHSRVYHFDFRSISKREFDLICKEHFPSISHRVKSLFLSNDDQTPNLFNRFYSYRFEFVRLQSLCIDSVNCLSLVNELLFECRRLTNLRRLCLFKCDFKDQKMFVDLIENIWNLKKLISCRIDHRFPYDLKLINETRNSTLENLSLENFQVDLNVLTHLFQCTPSLRQLNVSLIQRLETDRIHLEKPSTITLLKISFRKSFDFMYILFQNFPFLKRMVIQTFRLYLTGNDWKKIIRNCLPKLEDFQLKMEMKFPHPKHIEEQLEELIKSFQTQFWIEDKQWFVQCDWFNFGISQLATLYTIPYTFDEYLLTNKYWSKSTSPQNINYQSFHCVNHLTVINLNEKLDDFRNVTHLKLNLPLGNQFWLSFPSFDRLISLEITFIERSIYISFQILLDRSSRLQSICFSKCSDMEFVSKLTSQSVRRLDFLTKNVYKKYFTKQQCSTLRHSSLGSQCKSLLIPVESRTDVIYLVKSLPNLHSLTFQCKDDPFDDGFLHWFHRHLPSTCSIDRDANQTSHIRLWIR
ncbi:unnamed protein product [Adineta ricciae]|uniref:F-box domain-containing protein n=1 Tax=Adineta ricciae TaxID=249248 RepID=A0A815PSQ3_ADIRI|nr:unnamed protein product [Adineta ricciae]